MMSVLPKQFAELETLSDWAGSSEEERVERRRTSSPEELNKKTMPTWLWMCVMFRM